MKGVASQSHTFSAVELSFSSLCNAPWMRQRKPFRGANASDWHADDMPQSQHRTITDFSWTHQHQCNTYQQWQFVHSNIISNNTLVLKNPESLVVCCLFHNCDVNKILKLTGANWIGLCSVLRPRQHSTGYMGDGFYRSKDLTNSIKVLKENRCKYRSYLLIVF